MLTVGASHRTSPIAALGAMSAAAHDLDRLTRSPVNKLLHDPMIRLRAAAPDSEGG